MDKHTKLMRDLELLYNDWAREWGTMVREDTQPTRETIQTHLQELRKVMRYNIDYSKVDDLIKEACDE